MVAILVVSNHRPLMQRLVSLKSELQWPPEKEFHFAFMNEDERRRFFVAVDPYDFQVRAFVVDKNLISSPGLRTNGKLFRSYMTKLPLMCDWEGTESVEVIVDGSRLWEPMKGMDRQYQLGQINLWPSQNKITNIRYHSSDRHILLQAADMYAGAIRDRYEGRYNTPYASLVRARIDHLWEFSQK